MPDKQTKVDISDNTQKISISATWGLGTKFQSEQTQINSYPVSSNPVIIPINLISADGYRLFGGNVIFRIISASGATIDVLPEN